MSEQLVRRLLIDLSSQSVSFRVLSPGVRPSITQPLVEGFYNQCMARLQRIAALPDDMSTETRTRLSLPLRHGGCGYRSPGFTAPMAYWAATVAASSETAEIARHGAARHTHLLNFHDSLKGRKAALEAYLHMKNELGIPTTKRATPPPKIGDDNWRLLPFRFSDISDHYRGLTRTDKLQRQLTQAAEYNIVSAFSATAQNPNLTTQLRAAAMSNTANWLTSIPKNRQWELGRAELALNLRLRLGLSPLDLLPKQCSCGFSMPKDPWHALSCKFVRGASVTARHNNVRDRMRIFAQSHGVPAIPEPQTSTTSNEHPDIQFFFPNRREFTDVTVRHTLAPSYRGKSPQVVLDKAALDKTNKYRDMCEEQGGSFTPLVTSTLGHIHKTGAKLLKRIFEANPDITPADSLRDFKTEINAAVAKGNANIVQHWMVLNSKGLTASKQALFAPPR